jgi:hypothetical protein
MALAQVLSEITLVLYVAFILSAARGGPGFLWVDSGTLRKERVGIRRRDVPCSQRYLQQPAYGPSDRLRARQDDTFSTLHSKARPQ